MREFQSFAQAWAFAIAVGRPVCVRLKDIYGESIPWRIYPDGETHRLDRCTNMEFGSNNNERDL